MKTACTQACNFFFCFFLFSEGGKRLIRDRFFNFLGRGGGGGTGGIKRVTPVVYDDALSS